MNRLLISILFCFLLFACKKEENEKTPITSTTPTPPASTFKFSCKVNGVDWGTDSTYNQYLFETSGNYRVLTCGGFDSTKAVTTSWISMGVGSMAVAMDTSLMPSPGLILYEGYKNGVWLDEYFPISGKLHFTAFDSIAHTISGTFESIQVEPNINDTIILTNGVFTGLSFDVIVL